MDTTPAERYDAWYRTPRGAWIGDVEFALLARLLAARSGEQLLDVGCGSGYFTRRCARELGVIATGVDPDPAALHVASAQAGPGERYVEGHAERLPFADRSFDCTICVTALCFIADRRQALREMVRVTRRRIVLGLLNRASLLYLQKGRGGGSGAYRGAHWHTRREAFDLFAGLPASDPVIRSAVFLPGGGAIARAIESFVPGRSAFGAFLAVAADVTA